jgi:formylglycine-generating enzyme required for sulfatase activity/serine/threonine protein kinase
MNFADDTIGKAATGSPDFKRYEHAIEGLRDGAQFDQYTIIKLLGRGGMGAVYEARHVTLEEHFAIKVLPYEFMARRDAVQRFENEARVMAKLKHPNIVRVDDFRQTDGLYWLRMELARGDGKGMVSLQDLADAGGGMVDQTVLLDVMEDVLKGIAYAHRKGVIHRDLKPANILLFPKPGGGFTAKVSDYGLVKLLGEEFLRSRVTKSVQLSMAGAGPRSIGDESTEGGQKGTSTRALLGTWAYMSPEQQEGTEATTRSDVYSLGLICYQLLTGQKLTLRLPNQLNPKIVSEWNEILLKALENRPENRFADAAEMLKALEPVRKAIHTSVEQRQREKIEAKIKEIRHKAALAVQGGDLATALNLLTEAAETYPDHKRLREDMADIKKRMADRDAARRREEQRKAEEDRTKREEAARRRKEDEQRRLEEEQKRQADDRIARERSRRRLLVFGGIGGVIIVIAVIAGALFSGGGGRPGLIVSEPTGTPLPTYTPVPTGTPTQTATPTRIPTNTPVPRSGIFADPYHKKEVTVDLGGGVRLAMIYLQGGSFRMGSPSDEKDRDSDEGPVHTVELDGFWMGKFEVTQGQYQAVMGTNPSRFKGSNRPVENVSWNDAMAFCRKLSSKTGKTFTLPTEAQWEYACRAGTTGPFAFGNCLSTSDANYNGNYPLSGCSKGTYRESTWDVGSGRANAWGLYDMHGNVWEWCLDWYSENYYSQSPRCNPVGPGSGSGRVVRGGSWRHNAWICRSAYRSRYTPSDADNNLGFRIVMTDSS